MRLHPLIYTAAVSLGVVVLYSRYAAKHGMRIGA